MLETQEPTFYDDETYQDNTDSSSISPFLKRINYYQNKLLSCSMYMHLNGVTLESAQNSARYAQKLISILEEQAQFQNIE